MKFLVSLMLGGVGFMFFGGLIVGGLLGISYILKVLSYRQTDNHWISVIRKSYTDFHDNEGE